MTYTRYPSKFRNPRFFLSNLFISLLVLTAYFLLFAALLPDGVNQAFAERSWRLSLALAMGAGLAMLAFPKETKEQDAIKRRSEKITTSDLLLLLLPLIPVVQYIIRNQDILSRVDIFTVFGLFLAYSALFAVIVPKLLGGLASERTLMLLGVAFAFVLFSMASLSSEFLWFEEGNLQVQLSVLAGVFAVSWWLYELGYRRLLQIGVAFLFVSNGAVQLVSSGAVDDESNLEAGSANEIQKPSSSGKAETEVEPELDPDNRLVQLIGDREPPSTPNIYLLVYDAYVPNETMLSYGIDNRAQEEFLTEFGFTLYPRTYSLAASSLHTMTRVLDVEVEVNGKSRHAVAGGGTVQNLLVSFGYRTYGIFGSDYFFRGSESTYHASFPSQALSGTILSGAILKGEFRFDEGFNEVPYEDFIAAKRNALVDNSSSPLFLYAHSNYPGHSQHSGGCLPNETDLFEERLQTANEEIRQDVELLIANHPDAIIVVAGDHGPYLTKGCYITGDEYELSEITRQDIQDRFGAFLAIRWPTDGFDDYDNIGVLQHLFPSIFAYLFEDSKILDARMETKTFQAERISGARVENGIIQGGANDGEPLFVGGR